VILPPLVFPGWAITAPLMLKCLINNYVKKCPCYKLAPKVLIKLFIIKRLSIKVLSNRKVRKLLNGRVPH
jgi:hypothetical protein